MSVDGYKIANPQGSYFLSLTVVDGVDLFTKKIAQFAEGYIYRSA